MKILQAFNFLSLPHGGGTVDVVYKLSRALSTRGHEVTICTGDHELDTEYLSGLGDVGLKMYHSYINKYGVYIMPGLLNLDITDYDIVHLHSCHSFLSYVISSKARLYSVPYIVDAHGSLADSNKKHVLRNIYDKVFGIDILKNAKFLIAETETGVQEYARLGFNGNKVRIQHTLLDTDDFAVLPEEGTFKQQYHLDGSHIILFLGRIHGIKGIDTLLRASRSLLLDRDVILVIAGQDDGHQKTLMELANELGVENRVIFTGFIGGQDKLAALVDADVLVQPSRNEAGARPSLEAIMVGTPVIVSKDTGAGRKIAEFNGGLLFDTGNDVELTSALHEVLSEPEEAKARTGLARYYIIKNLSLENQVGEYEKLYGEALQS